MSSVYTPEFDPETGKPLRKVQSFVRREGRLTRGQERALAELWPQFGIEYRPQPVSSAALFGHDAVVSRALVVEIGFGMGKSLLAMAQAEPEKDFLGIEVHAPGVGALLMGIEEQSIRNLRVMRHDAVEVLTQMLPDASIDRLQLYFPDPWHKKKHHKRRIVQADFLQLLARKLKPGGLFHFATDWQPYAEWTLELVRAEPLLQNLSPAGDYVPQPAWRPDTKFEARGERLGHGVRDLLCRRI
ncbi:MAG: tRNA (guanosine(46)-N7)-methyltransferase TrmB [Pseudomonadota bacterium]